MSVTGHSYYYGFEYKKKPNYPLLKKKEGSKIIHMWTSKFFPLLFGHLSVFDFLMILFLLNL